MMIIILIIIIITISQYVEDSFWRRLRTCRKTYCRMN
jgi:hypothetical protein